MEERLPPPDGAPKDLHPPLLTAFPESLSTYIVQIPRDQVYRVPPPENARIVEEYHTRNPPEKQKRFRGIFFYVVIPVVLICILAGISIAIVRAALYSPKSPKLTVTQIQAKNLHSPEYDVTLRASNPNPRMSVTYRGPGTASLVFKNEKIGNGGIPRSIKENPNTAIDIPVVLLGKGIQVAAEIKKSLNGTAEKLMSLKVDVAVEINSWVKNERKDLSIACDFKVQNSLMHKTTKISFQDCRTEF
ncbi:hypothetical protein BUALT_Bualt04G0020300 [Buddleja alternifolia]|uniref:Late embryogenesis abundant protein LEA-2 subgroup domain-containing protein n=1 Tax=Buddleja alternifolia TaxID=168488 RepID=A0AAV6XKM8_9LAMI|nr:hypothetical protein BUALT_Bualt04G0020300 [Buddleja alternifolia]